MEIRSDRINFLLADLDDDARRHIKQTIRSIAAEALPRDDRAEGPATGGTSRARVNSR